ncbi:MAG: hypothetical protein HY820_31715 [Acidobacteria bacterium]|nr:hypothetical protein [Acidobacteriota bacterium]
MNRRSLMCQSVFATAATLLGARHGRAQSRGSKALIGAWDVTTIYLDGDQPPNIPLTSRRLVTFAEGGTVFDNSGLPGEIPAEGVWEFAGANIFEGTWVRLIRDAQGQVVGTNRVRSQIRLTTEDEYENEAKIDVFNLAGATLFSWRARGQGRRIKLDSFE